MIEILHVVVTKKIHVCNVALDEVKLDFTI